MKDTEGLFHEVAEQWRRLVSSAFPKPNNQINLALTFQEAAPRALLRVMPGGRSLNVVSPLSSRPVVTL
jgi:hypothetical protein